MAILDLYVNSWDGTKDEWPEKVGASPYLDAQDYPDNYVKNETIRKAECGDFGFVDSGKTTETINSVYLYIYAVSADKYGITVFLWDGSSYHELTGWEAQYSWSWRSEDVSTILNTWAKIDAAKIYLKSPNSTALKVVDCAYLKVDYTAVAVTEKGFSDVGNGSDAFVNPYRAMGFSEVGGGVETFGTPFKALGFSEVGGGLDVFNTPYREMRFSDAGLGTDVFSVLLEILFSDAGLGTDVFTQEFVAPPPPTPSVAGDFPRYVRL